jgi:translation initiation factor 2 alpha subunit (eIF-2alpha)
MQDRPEASGLDLMNYDKGWGRYRIRLQTSDLDKCRKILKDIIAEAYAEANKE